MEFCDHNWSFRQINQAVFQLFLQFATYDRTKIIQIKYEHGYEFKLCFV